MKQRFFSITVILILAVLALAGCSRNKPVETKQDGYKLAVVSKTVYTVLQVPAWLLFPPEDETAVAIALETNKRKPSVTDVAAEFAQSSFALNNSTFAVDPQEIIRLSEELNPAITPSDIKLSLLPDTGFIPAGQEQLMTQAETELQGYKLYLMGPGNPTINYDIVRASVDRTPKWCKTQETTEDDDFVYVVGTAINPLLPDAWKAAQENAMQKLGQYRIFKALPDISQAVSERDKMSIIEKVTQNPQASFAKTWLFHKQVDGNADYSVFIMLKAPRVR
jgi:hypothetical protein